jgi:SAM-dependent methyltransferase
MREHSFGQDRALSPVDRFGVWLSARAIHHAVPAFRGLRVGDFGCGYDATFVRSVLPEVASAVLVDVSLAPDLRADPKVRAIEGGLPDALGPLDDESLDVVMCTSVLEHLWEPELALGEFHRVLAPGGACLVNVPTWLGKRFLELSAFTLGTSGPEEIADHKRYFDPKDLWPLLVRAGFPPDRIRCHRHKFGLNTFAACRRPGTP